MSFLKELVKSIEEQKSRSIYSDPKAKQVLDESIEEIKAQGRVRKGWLKDRLKTLGVKISTDDFMLIIESHLLKIHNQYRDIYGNLDKKNTFHLLSVIHFSDLVYSDLSQKIMDEYVEYALLASIQMESNRAIEQISYNSSSYNNYSNKDTISKLINLFNKNIDISTIQKKYYNMHK